MLSRKNNLTFAIMDANQLAKEFGPKISGLAHRMISNPELAREAAQETWVAVLKHLDQFRAESRISTWIFTIAKRVILKYSQSERVYKTKEINTFFEREPILFEGDESEKYDWVKNTCDHCLTAFCHCLNSEARIIFLFRDIVELNYEEIGQIMEMHPENARKILSRSRQKVRNFMTKNCFLFNPDASCKCRIKQQISGINLQQEYSSLEQTAKLANFYKKFDQQLPRKNYWEKFLQESVTK